MAPVQGQLESRLRMMNGGNPVANQLQFNSSAKDESNIRGGGGNATEFKDNHQNHMGAGL